ncbi:hypothetical protein [Yoonia sp.]|uniref:hypothetical protein n=1 Tax=Yoonia sp. TaxID=2212373 RepID=UPI003F6D1126
MKAAIRMKMRKLAAPYDGLRLGYWDITPKLKSDGTGERHAGRPENNTWKLCDLTQQLF